MRTLVTLVAALALLACSSEDGGTALDVPQDGTLDVAPFTPDGAPDAAPAPDLPIAPDVSGDTGSGDILLDATDLQGPDVAACEPVVAEPGVGPWGFPMDGWTWERLGVVLDAPTDTFGATEGWIGPALVVDGEQLVLYATRKQGLQHRIWRSTSLDGSAWTEPELLSGLGDDDVIAYPAVVREPNRWRLWFASGWIRHAESSDGLTFVVSEEPSLRAGEAGAFDALSVLYPAVLPQGSGYTLWYTGFSGTSYAVGRAVSDDGLTFTRAPDGPVLEAGAEGEHDNTAVAQSAALTTGDGFLLWYGGYDTSRTDPGPYRIGLAASPDGVTWTKRGVTLDLPESGPEAYSTRDPAVVRWGDGLFMVYAGMGDDYRYRLLAARTRTCH